MTPEQKKEILNLMADSIKVFVSIDDDRTLLISVDIVNPETKETIKSIENYTWLPSNCYREFND
jgi:hypothetical protein